MIGEADEGRRIGVGMTREEYDGGLMREGEAADIYGIKQKQSGYKPIDAKIK